MSNQNRRILVVEDVDDNRFMMKCLLEMSGYSVLEATNGEEAVSVARHELPDLILMDLSLPVVDGITATRIIHDIGSLQYTPVIALTAQPPQEFLEPALAAGCSAYVSKPVDFDKLEMLIEDLLHEEACDQIGDMSLLAPQFT